jgi:hypothetical protein
MEAKLYAALYQLVFSTAHPRRKREQFCDRWVMMIYLWSAIWGRPVSWACKTENWPASLDRPLVSQSRMSRRLWTVGMSQLFERLLATASGKFDSPIVKQIDSKPLTVGAYSKDENAKRGRLAVGQFGRGYRLHALSHGRIFKQFLIDSLNTNDAAVGPRLLSRLEGGGGGYVLGDNAYDGNDCHVAAGSTGHQLVAPPRRDNKGKRDGRYNGPERLRGLDIIDSPLETCGEPSAFGQALYADRQRIESGFAGLTYCGLGALPPWVRTPRRVALWAAAKLLIYLTTQALNKGLMT